MNKEIRKQIFATVKLGFVLIFAVTMNSHVLEAEAPDAMSGSPADDAREILMLARTIWSESKRKDEQVMIAWVVRNRLNHGYWGDTYEEVVLSPSQFSGFNSNDPQYKLNSTIGYEDVDDAHPSWKTAVSVAREVYYAPSFLNPLQDATHFYSPMAVKYQPKWAQTSDPILVLRDTEHDYIRFAFFKNIM